MEFNFKGKTALVTGAGKGIGRGIVKALWAGGAMAYAASRTQADLDSLETECPGLKGIRIDLSNWDGAKAAVEGLGPIDLLVNNAGVSAVTSVGKVTPDNYDFLMNTNVKALLNVTQVVAEGMKARKSGGSIVNISSTASSGPYVGGLVYCASKAAVDMITKCLALELQEHGIRVNSVRPGPTETPMMQRAREGPDAPEFALTAVTAPICDVAHPVLYLLSDKAHMISGTFITVNDDNGFQI